MEQLFIEASNKEVKSAVFQFVFSANQNLQKILSVLIICHVKIIKTQKYSYISRFYAYDTRSTSEAHVVKLRIMLVFIMSGFCSVSTKLQPDA